MRKLWLTMVMVISVPLAGRPQKSCYCQPTEKYGYGGHETIIIQEPKVHRRLAGTVVDASSATLKGAIVEVFTTGEKDGRKRVAACIVGESGQFCFPQFKQGTYTLSVSAQGFKVTEITLKLNSKSRAATNEEMIVYLPVGT